MSPAQQARAARGITERALDAAGWPVNVRLSRWLDALLVLEERERMTRARPAWRRRRKGHYERRLRWNLKPPAGRLREPRLDWVR